MNVLYTGVYFIDILRLAVVLCGIFGFSFSKRRSALFGSAVLVLTGALVIPQTGFSCRYLCR